MPYAHILVPSDGSELSQRAIDHAVQLASRLGARLTFLHVHANVPLPLGGLGEALDPRTMEALIAASLLIMVGLLGHRAAMTALGAVPADTWMIGDVEIPSRIVLAPMAGVSVQAFRRQGRRQGRQPRHVGIDRLGDGQLLAETLGIPAGEHSDGQQGRLRQTRSSGALRSRCRCGVSLPRGGRRSASSGLNGWRGGMRNGRPRFSVSQALCR